MALITASIARHAIIVFSGYQPSVHHVIWSSLVKDHFADTACWVEEWTIIHEEHQVTWNYTMRGVMPFYNSTDTCLHSVSPSLLFYHGAFFKHGGYAIFFKKNKQSDRTLSNDHLLCVPTAKRFCLWDTRKKSRT